MKLTESGCTVHKTLKNRSKNSRVSFLCARTIADSCDWNKSTCASNAKQRAAVLPAFAAAEMWTQDDFFARNNFNKIGSADCCSFVQLFAV